MASKEDERMVCANCLNFQSTGEGQGVCLAKYSGQLSVGANQPMCWLYRVSLKG